MSSYKKSAVRHWSERVNEAVILRGSNGSFNLCIEGGSEYGQFVVIGDIISDKVNYKLGNLSPGELVLEINGRHVAGYTQTDAIALIKQSQDALELISVYPGQGISRDLRKYLGTRFQRGSVDHELQQTIRDNLYMRTVPCTTRQPRDGEVPGVDYEFLTVDQYLELEKSGKLLESGFYEGNYYGTPKPPKTPMTPGTGTIRKVKKKPSISNSNIATTNGQANQIRKPDETAEIPPLPKNWQVAYTKDGEAYYVDHSTGRTQWEDPRKKVTMTASSSQGKLASTSQQSRDAADEELPEGWEKVEDSKYGTYYIDHVNRRTQYERPTTVSTMKRRTSQSSVHSTKSMDRDQRKKSVENIEIKGETFRVGLRKGDKGFGFTIVGGERPGELLQINNIVRGGTADLDGRLRTGDTIVRLNGRNVTAWTHQDIVRFLQSTRLGDLVEVDIVRGYSLPFDPQDPSIKKVGTNVFVKSSTSIGEGSLGSIHAAQSTQSLSSNASNNKRNHREYSMDEDGYQEIGNGLRKPNTPTPSRTSSRAGPPELYKVTVTKGNRGFGFTLADSSYGQRVKEILDVERCRGLQYGDLLLQINNTKVQHLDHSEVVDMLKFCPRDVETFFIVQRGGTLTPVKPVPAPPVRRDSTSRTNDQPMRPQSTPVTNEYSERRSNGPERLENDRGIATAGETTENKSTHYREERDRDRTFQRDNNPRRSSSSAASADVATTSSDFVMTLKRGEGGFGFRITGGQEEQTQVAIDTIVPNGEADRDGRLHMGDLILAIDGINVVGASHRRVISLMGNGALNGQVTLRVRRRGESSPNTNHNSTSSAIQDGRRSAPPSASYTTSTNTTSHSSNGYQSDAPQNLRQNKLATTGRAKSLTNGVAMSEVSNLTPAQQQSRPRPKSLTGGIADGAINGWGDDPSGMEAREDDSMRRQSAGRIFQSTPDVTQVVRASETTTVVTQRVERPGPKHVPPPIAPKPKSLGKPNNAKEIVLRRNENEGFGFVIMSSVSKVGSIIGRIIPGSPADRCGELKVEDRLLAVNGRSVADMPHSDIVASVKHSGMAVTLKIERTPADKEVPRPQSVPATQLNAYRQSDTEVDQEMQRREAVQRHRDDFRRQQQEILQKQQDEMRRLEEARRRGVRDRELNQPPRPKSAPINRDNEMQNGNYGNDVDSARWNGGHSTARETSTSNSFNQRQQQFQRVTVQSQSQSNNLSTVDRRNMITSSSTPSLREERKPLVAVRKINAGDVANIVLPRGEKGFGFSIRGGEALPLFVLRIAEGGPAALDGRLRVGDEILQINGKSTESLSHADAVGMIRLCTDRVNIVIKRPLKAPGDEQIPNGQPRTSSRGDDYFTIPRSGSSRSMERPKSVNY